MKRLIIAILATLTGWCHADPPAPFPIEINSQSRVAPEVWTFRNNVRTFRATFKDGTNAVSLVGAIPFMSWSTNENASGVVTSSWALVQSGTGGVVDFTFTAAALNYASQTNVYEIGVAGTVAVYNRGRFLIKPSPFSTGTNVQPFVTNQNLSGMSFVNAPWFENLTLTTSGSAYAWSGTGTTRNLNVPTNTAVALSGGSGVTTNVRVGASSSSRLVVSNGASAEVTLVFDAGGLATGTPLYVEAYTGSVGTVAGLATGSPLYVEAFTGSVGTLSGVATGTPLYVETDTAAIAQVNAASSTLRIAIGLVDTNLILNGLADTNDVIALGLVTTNQIRTGLIHTNLAGLVTTNFNSIGLQLTNNLIAQGLISTNLTVNGLQITNNLIAQGLINTQLIANGLADTNLSGRVTTNFTAQGLIQTNLILNGLADTNNLIADGLLSTNHIRTGLIHTNLAGLVTTNFAHFTTLNDSAVSKTSLLEQTMSSSLASLGTLHAKTNLVAANTNSVGSELLNNGTFTGNMTGWVGTNLTYNANNVIVLPGATASLTYTSTTPVVVGGVYLLSWANDISAGGADFTRFDVVVGGDTNSFGVAPTGTIARIFKARNTQQPQFYVTPGATNQWIGDTVSLKQITDGDVIAGDDGYFEHLYVKGGITTTGVISGVVTGYLPLVGGTMTGPVTNPSVFAGVGTIQTQLNMAANGIGILFQSSGEDVVLAGVDQGVKLTNTVGGDAKFIADIFETGESGALRVYVADGGLYNNSDISIADYQTNGTFRYGETMTVSNGNVRSTRFYGDGSGLTNLPAAATTAGVNSIILDATNYTGNQAFSNSPEIDVVNTNAAFEWKIFAGTIASNKLTNTVWNQIAAMDAAAVASVAQTGQVNGIAINGTNYSGGLGFSGSALSVSGTSLVFNASGADLAALSNSVAGLLTGTNAYTPTALTIGAGTTCLITRAANDSFRLTPTGGAVVIAIDATSWATNEGGIFALDLQPGTTLVTYASASISASGVNSSTNITYYTDQPTKLIFDRAAGSTSITFAVSQRVK